MQTIAGMTVAEFLEKTTIPIPEIAEKVGVHFTQVYRWKNGGGIDGENLVKLIGISGGLITSVSAPATAKKRKRAA